MNLSMNTSNFTLDNSTNTNEGFMPPASNPLEGFMTYKIRKFLDLTFYPAFLPIGFIGNVLSFLVMMQPHNRHLSIPFYLALLAVADNITLIIALVIYLGTMHDRVPSNMTAYCSFRITTSFSSAMCGVYIILAMTFDRFYGIIKPHKASSTNTRKRAKITSLIIIVCSIIYNIPHMFLSLDIGTDCVPFGRYIGTWYRDVYYWLNFVINYCLPFMALLIMNSFIIRAVRNRQKFNVTNVNDQRRVKSTDIQVFIILLLVTFSFLLLTGPAYMYFLLVAVFNFRKTLKLQADFQLFFAVGQRLWYMNSCINFFLYILSGTKFRNDFLKLFGCYKTNKPNTPNTESKDTAKTQISAISKGADDEIK